MSMKAEDIPDRVSGLLPDLQVVQFVRVPQCPKCTYKFGDRYPTTKKDDEKEAELVVIKFGYCPGNQQAEIEVQDLVGRSHKHRVTCAGLVTEHLHLQCTNCSFCWLMACAAAEQPSPAMTEKQLKDLGTFLSGFLKVRTGMHLTELVHDGMRKFLAGEELPVGL